MHYHHKFIRTIATGTASEHDSTHFDEALDAHNTSGDVYASKPLSECQKGRNQRIAKTRARVEHPFAQMRHMGGKLIRTIGQARATVAMTMMAVCYNLKRLAKFLGDGADAFYKACPSKTGVRLHGVNT